MLKSQGAIPTDWEVMVLSKSSNALVVTEAQQYTEDPTVPRYRRPPTRLDQGAAPHQFSAAEDYY